MQIALQKAAFIASSTSSALLATVYYLHGGWRKGSLRGGSIPAG